MIASFGYEQTVKVFSNNKYGFELFQTIQTFGPTYNLGVNGDGSMFAASI